MGGAITVTRVYRDKRILECEMLMADVRGRDGNNDMVVTEKRMISHVLFFKEDNEL